MLLNQDSSSFFPAQLFNLLNSVLLRTHSFSHARTLFKHPKYFQLTWMALPGRTARSQKRGELRLATNENDSDL